MPLGAITLADVAARTGTLTALVKRQGGGRSI
jgi:hypothetical protein